MLRIAALVILLKAFLLAADPYPSFHFGDSGAYLATALTKWIPADRSFTYGFFLRPLVLRSHSLFPVVLVQTTMSAAASSLMGVLLMRYFRASFRVALVCSVLCAIEPLQLMSERFIMTEALATFAFSLYLWAWLEFLRTQRFLMLVIAQCLAVILASVRYSFIPLVIILSVAVPLLSPRWHLRSNLKPVLLRLSLAFVLCQAGLAGYRHLYGHAAQTKPAYLSRDGDFLIADFAPLIERDDFPIPDARAELFRRLTVPLRDIDQRRFHRWMPGGLCDAVLHLAHGDEDLANQLARKTALHAANRNPWGVLRLGLGTYREFLSYNYMKWSLELDEGHFVSPTTNDSLMIWRTFRVHARDRHFDSLTKRWEAMAVPWCWVLVLLPVVFGLNLVFRRREASSFELLLWVCSAVILLSALIPVEIANARYLTPLPWLACLMLGVMAASWSVDRSRRFTLDGTLMDGYSVRSAFTGSTVSAR